MLDLYWETYRVLASITIICVLLYMYIPPEETLRFLNHCVLKHWSTSVCGRMIVYHVTAVIIITRKRWAGKGKNGGGEKLININYTKINSQSTYFVSIYYSDSQNKFWELKGNHTVIGSGEKPALKRMLTSPCWRLIWWNYLLQVWGPKVEPQNLHGRKQTHSIKFTSQF